MKLGKIIGGIVTVVCAPLVVVATSEVAATTNGAIAVVYGGLSESVSIASGVTAMKVADKATLASGVKMISEGLDN